jgi:unconventional prefoldin RPB5 interactor 1
MPPDPYELDEALHRQEVVTEFYKLRNRRIQQEGGFLQDDEESQQMVPLGEAESGEPRKKVSRFMAARMK